ncbi:hypothetical protein HDU97_007947 [Phlyctochytrium planicorne]|nr:hypothetical protein HDU97_007947 [Phlyctochytrium planicorne]
MAHVDLTDKRLRDEEQSVTMEFEDALRAGSLSPNLPDYFRSRIKYRLARGFNEAIMCACRHGELKLLRHLKSGLPVNVEAVLNKEGILLMAARSRDVGVIKNVVNMFDIKVEREFVVKVAKDFQGCGKEVVECLCGHAGLPGQELLKIAVEIGSVDCFDAFWDRATLVDPWERWFTLSFNAVKLLKAPTPDSGLGQIPACRLFKNLVAELDQEFKVLQEGYIRVISALRRNVMRSQFLIAFVCFLSVDVSALSKFALVTAALKVLDRFPVALSSLFNDCWRNPELDEVVVSFFDSEINNASSSKQQLWNLLSATELFRTDHCIFKMLNISRLIEMRDLRLLALHEPWICYRSSSTFAKPSQKLVEAKREKLDEAKRAIARNDLASLLWCCLDCDTNVYELASWVVGREDREMLSVDVVLVLLASCGYFYDKAVWKDLFDVLFEVAEERNVKAVEMYWCCWAGDMRQQRHLRNCAEDRIKRFLTADMRERASAFFLNR